MRIIPAEKQLVQALPRMAKAANDPQLAKAFNTHLRQTERQVARLERIFKDLGESPRGKKCVGMEGLIEEGKEIMTNGEDPHALEAGLIGAAQKVEHYEIAAYGTAAAHARQLGFNSVAQLLDQQLPQPVQHRRPGHEPVTAHAPASRRRLPDHRSAG